MNYATPAATPAEDKKGFLQRLRAGLNRGAGPLGYDLAQLLSGKTVDSTALEELETRLLMADVGVEATQQVMRELQRRLDAGRVKTADQLMQALREQLLAILQPCSVPLAIPDFIRPYVILMVGVNGVGKTTTIGKLAQH
ncbi:MAG: signal recognition particle receptor subunit alpha, partial [Nevskiales bacterium]